VVFPLLFVSTCAREQNVTPFKTTGEAVKSIDSFKGKPEDFELPIAETLFDPSGANMAIITDRALGKGWMPNGFRQEKGYRVFKYISIR
jgi:hypothetical protein